MANNMSWNQQAGQWEPYAGTPEANASLAMVHIVYQPAITRIYNAEDALRQGTLFPELDKPFLGYRGVVRG